MGTFNEAIYDLYKRPIQHSALESTNQLISQISRIIFDLVAPFVRGLKLYT